MVVKKLYKNFAVVLAMCLAVGGSAFCANNQEKAMLVGGGAAIGIGLGYLISSSKALVGAASSAIPAQIATITSSIDQNGPNQLQKFTAGTILVSLLWWEVSRCINELVRKRDIDPRTTTAAIVDKAKHVASILITAGIAYWGGPALLSSGQWLFNSLSVRSCGACGASGW